MHIKSIDPANMRGHAGGLIQSLSGYWAKHDGIFRRGMPLDQQQLWYRCEADGENLPTMLYKGRQAFLNEIMEGQFGEDYAASVRNQDPRFAAAVAAAFPSAVNGHGVSDMVQMEVTPPGMTKPRFVEYYRIIRRFQVGVIGLRQPKFLLSVLVVPTDAWRVQFLRSTIRPGEMTPVLHS